MYNCALKIVLHYVKALKKLKNNNVYCCVLYFRSNDLLSI